MALKFLARNPHEIFFSTVHIHDGDVAQTAEFDHTLYLQSKLNNAIEWERSIYSVAKFMDLENVLKGDRTRGIIDRQGILSKTKLSGYLLNQDTVVTLS